MSISAVIAPIFLLWSAPFADPLETLAFPSPELASRNIVQCGAEAVEIRYDNLDNSDGFSPSPILVVHGATEEQLPCIDRAVGFYDVELPPELQKGFDAIRLAQYMAAYRARAAAALAARGLLDKVPKFRAGETDAIAFARQLEAICGPAAAGALQSSYGPHVLSPEWVSRLTLPSGPEDDAISCLMAAASTADFELNLIGNEAISQ
ncbi:MAG: hypothetical protein WA940_18940 [Sphingopyxis sp.]